MGSQEIFSFRSRAKRSVPPVVAPWRQDDGQREADQDAAEDGGQHGVHGRELDKGIEQVHEDGGDEHRIQRGEEQMTAQQPPSEEEERDIEQDDKHADGGPGEGGVDDLGQTGDAAEADLIGGVTQSNPRA